MQKISGFFIGGLCALLVTACDLQPRIMSLPDSVGDFISDRYPALLADPESQPEIYNSAASDYGVYASPDLYGATSTDDYILYSDINDYMFPAQPVDVPIVADTGPVSAVVIAEYTSPEPDVASDNGVVSPASDDVLVVPMYGGVRDTHTVTVAKGDTLYAIARKYGMSVDDVANMNNLSAPYTISPGQTLRVSGNGDIKVAADKVVATSAKTEIKTTVVAAPANTPAKAPTPARVQLQTITVGAGDTLYSISRKYSVPVNDLAVMNDLSAPFRLSVGQKLRVPDLQRAAANVSVSNATPKTAPVKPLATAVSVPKTDTKQVATPKTATPKKDATTRNTTDNIKTAAAPKQKISSDPKQKLPTIAARSSSKFSWPVRGKILSGFGSKPNGLVNDGINIAASRGTTVKAAENGVVAYAGNEVKGMGNLIILQHSGGWMTVYAHLDSIGLRRGAKVSVGQKIGTVGTTGKVDQPQLHFEIRKGTKAYNPSQYLKK